MSSQYSDRLRDPRWQRRRLEIFERDGWRCRRCRAAHRPLHVHHKRYLSSRDPWDYPDHYLETLCELCHRGEHGRRVDRIQEYRPRPMQLLDRIAHLESIRRSADDDLELECARRMRSDRETRGEIERLVARAPMTDQTLAAIKSLTSTLSRRPS